MGLLANEIEGNKRMSERRLDKLILLEYSKGDCRLFKNDNGYAELRNGAWIRFGLAPGSSDLVGAKSIIITPEMIGKKIAVAVVIEDKLPKKDGGKNPTRLQKNFLMVADKLGCIAGVARAVQDVQNIFDSWLAKMQS